MHSLLTWVQDGVTDPKNAFTSDGTSPLRRQNPYSLARHVASAMWLRSALTTAEDERHEEDTQKEGPTALERNFSKTY